MQLGTDALKVNLKIQLNDITVGFSFHKEEIFLMFNFSFRLIALLDYILGSLEE